MSGFSISAPKAVSDTQVADSKNVTAVHTPAQAEILIKENWSRIVGALHARNRPRLANSLSGSIIEGAAIKVIVPTQTLCDEILQTKLEIESEILNVCGVRAIIEVEIKEVVQAYRPVSVEQKLQYLVDKNPNILKLQAALELTL